MHFSVLYFLLLVATLINSSNCQDDDPLPPPQGRMVMTNDFEARTYYPVNFRKCSLFFGKTNNLLCIKWVEESPGTAVWKVENVTYPWETGSPVPKPRKGSNVLRAVRNAALNASMAVIRSPPFTVSPGDSISFHFWIRSNVTKGTNLEVGLCAIFDGFFLAHLFTYYNDAVALGPKQQRKPAGQIGRLLQFYQQPMGDGGLPFSCPTNVSDTGIEINM